MLTTAPPVTSCSNCRPEYGLTSHLPREQTCCDTCIAQMAISQVGPRCPPDRSTSLTEPLNPNPDTFGLRESSSQLLTTTQTCTSHGKDARFVCMNCAKRICRECKNEDHLGHVTQSFAVINEQADNKIDDFRERFESLNPSQKRIFANIHQEKDDLLNILREESTKIENGMRLFFQTIKDSIEEYADAKETTVSESLKDERAFLNHCQSKVDTLTRKDVNATFLEALAQKIPAFGHDAMIHLISDLHTKSTTDNFTQNLKGLFATLFNPMGNHRYQFPFENEPFREKLHRLSFHEDQEDKHSLVTTQPIKITAMIASKSELVVSILKEPEIFKVRLDELKMVKKVKIDLSQNSSVTSQEESHDFCTYLECIKVFLGNIEEVDISFSPEHFTDEVLTILMKDIANGTQRINLKLQASGASDKELINFFEKKLPRMSRVKHMELNFGGAGVSGIVLEKFGLHNKTIIDGLQSLQVFLGKSTMPCFNFISSMSNTDGSEAPVLTARGNERNYTFIIKLVNTILPSRTLFKDIILRFQDTSIGDEQVKMLFQRLPSTTDLNLNLSQTRITDETIRYFALPQPQRSMRTMQTLNINLSQTNLIGEWLHPMLATMPDLKELNLNLRETKIKDKNKIISRLWSHIASMQNLRSLHIDVTGTSVGDTEVMEHFRSTSIEDFKIALSGNKTILIKPGSSFPSLVQEGGLGGIFSRLIC